MDKSHEDPKLLGEQEDRYWAEQGRQALEEFERSGEEPVDWAKLRKKLGL